MNIAQQVSQLYALLEEGNPVRAMELFYHDNVTMQENDDEPRKGKAFCLQYESGLMASVKNFTVKILLQAINEESQSVFTEMEIAFTRNNVVHILNEVSVQTWKDGKVFSEKFYYKGIGTR